MSDKIGTNDYEEIPVESAGKRCGLRWAPRMGDWFTSWSPRNSNSNAEGPWDHWVDLALAILHDQLTAKVRPEAHAAVAGLARQNFYTETAVDLTDDDLLGRFGDRLNKRVETTPSDEVSR